MGELVFLQVTPIVPRMRFRSRCKNDAGSGCPDRALENIETEDGLEPATPSLEKRHGLENIGLLSRIES